MLNILFFSNKSTMNGIVFQYNKYIYIDERKYLHIT